MKIRLRFPWRGCWYEHAITGPITLTFSQETAPSQRGSEVEIPMTVEQAEEVVETLREAIRELNERLPGK
jgi:hypothetical protein